MTRFLFTSFLFILSLALTGCMDAEFSVDIPPPVIGENIDVQTPDAPDLPEPPEDECISDTWLDIESPVISVNRDLWIGESDQVIMDLPMTARESGLWMEYQEMSLAGTSFPAAEGGNFTSVELCLEEVCWPWEYRGAAANEEYALFEPVELLEDERIILQFSVDVPEDTLLEPGQSVFVHYKTEVLQVSDENDCLLQQSQIDPDENVNGYEYFVPL